MTAPTTPFAYIRPLIFWVLVLLFGLKITIQADAQNIKISHCLGGCPVGASSENDLIIREIYALSFNNSTLVADWVVYRVTDQSIGIASNLSRLTLMDPFVETTLTEQDYVDSTSLAQVERSLFVPLISFAGTPYWEEVNYLTNMVPRNPELTRGSWYGLEWAVRNMASRAGETYVITGPLYDPVTPHVRLATDKTHQVPTGFFKVIANSQGAISAFSFDQELAFHVHHCDRRTTLQEIERLTGLDLFPENPQWPLANLDQSLGCF